MYKRRHSTRLPDSSIGCLCLQVTYRDWETWEYGLQAFRVANTDHEYMRSGCRCDSFIRLPRSESGRSCNFPYTLSVSAHSNCHEPDAHDTIV